MIQSTRSMVRRSRRRLASREAGRAIVEFVFLAVLLLVPLIYLVMLVGRVQAAAFSASAAAREAGRAFTTSAVESEASRRANAAAAIAFEDYGFADSGRLLVSCDGNPCLRSEGKVSSRATITVDLPLMPDFLADALPATVPVSATHVAVVDRFAGR